MDPIKKVTFLEDSPVSITISNTNSFCSHDSDFYFKAACGGVLFWCKYMCGGGVGVTCLCV